MATEQELREKILQLENKLKEASEASEKQPKVIYTRDKKFPLLSQAEDFEEWISMIEKHTKVRFKTEEERIMFLLEHVDSKSKQEIKFRCIVEKSSLAEVVTILKDLHQSTDTLLQLQQRFYSLNQKDGQSLEEYATDLTTLINRIVDKQSSLSSTKENIIKEKFAEGVSDVQLKRELKRLNEERSTLKFWELRKHAFEWKKEDDHSKSSTDNSHQATSEGIKCGEYSEIITKQQKQIEELTGLVKELKSINDKPSHSRYNPPRRFRSVTCFYCKEKGHIKANCFKLKKDNDLNRQPPADK